jgi:hypothetical protein
MSTFKSYLITIVYGITAIYLLIACLQTDVSQIIGISVKDSYTALAQKHVLFVLTVLFFLFTVIALVQESLRRPLIKFLCWIHYIVTVCCLLILRYILLVAAAPDTNSDYSLPENIDEASRQNADWKMPLLVVGTALVIAQALFLLNVIITQFKKRTVPEQETATAVED